MDENARVAAATSFGFVSARAAALSRAATGALADKYGGGRVTIWTFVVMIAATCGVLFFVAAKDQPGAFWGFFAMFMILFFATGVGNASTNGMIPVIMRQEVKRLMPNLDDEQFQHQTGVESAAIIAWTSAMGAYGAFFIPKAFGTSISATGGPQAALIGFLVFYVTCLAITWFFYTRKNAPVPA